MSSQWMSVVLKLPPKSSERSWSEEKQTTWTPWGWSPTLFPQLPPAGPAPPSVSCIRRSPFWECMELCCQFEHCRSGRRKTVPPSRWDWENEELGVGAIVWLGGQDWRGGSVAHDWPTPAELCLEPSQSVGHWAKMEYLWNITLCKWQNSAQIILKSYQNAYICNKTGFGLSTQTLPLPGKMQITNHCH